MFILKVLKKYLFTNSSNKINIVLEIVEVGLFWEFEISTFVKSISPLKITLKGS